MEVRKSILDFAYGEMKLAGFQGLRADKSLPKLKISKGSLYHYFPNKFALGYAIVDEIIATEYLSRWKPLEDLDGDVIDYFVDSFERMKKYEGIESLKKGCVLNNLIQEMSPLDEGFRLRLKEIIREMHRCQSLGLQRGIEKGQIKSTIDVVAEAYFIQSGIEGAYSLAKVNQDREIFHSCIDSLIRYVNDLRA